VLALAVTVIESSLIVSMLLDGGPGSAAIARDTVFATVMIVCNGVVGCASWSARCGTASSRIGSRARRRRFPCWRR
jgi:Ca2+/H+ antiporter